ncbi:MAG: aldehyde dehydrogenase family protein, partial [Actinobacteria bacterium]|nr:aldehyde dehydrogenase family protein [Actinomycetota bacterium]
MDAAGKLPQLNLFLAGRWVDPVESDSFIDLNPATEEELATVAAAGPADVDAAVAAARAQLDGGAWSRLSGGDRGRLLTRLAEALERDGDRLAALEALDVG